jgi:hypothetical protein
MNLVTVVAGCGCGDGGHSGGSCGVAVVVPVVWGWSGDGVVMVLVEGDPLSSVCEGIGAEFETTRKMGSENESKNDQFCKSEDRVRFFKNDHFPYILRTIFEK